MGYGVTVGYGVDVGYGVYVGYGVMGGLSLPMLPSLSARANRNIAKTIRKNILVVLKFQL